MTFDPDKVIRFLAERAIPNIAKVEVEVVASSDYNSLLQLYREEQVKSANAAFLEQTDAAITESQAKTIARLEAEKNG